MALGPAVLVPLGPAGDVRGVLTAGRRQGSLPLSADAVEMLITFAAQAGIGLELAEHRSDAQRLALFEDRDRIARDLHDLVIQRLFATGMSLQGSGGPAGRPRGRAPGGEVDRRAGRDDQGHPVGDLLAAVPRGSPAGPAAHQDPRRHRRR